MSASAQYERLNDPHDANDAAAAPSTPVASPSPALGGMPAGTPGARVASTPSIYPSHESHAAGGGASSSAAANVDCVPIATAIPMHPGTPVTAPAYYAHPMSSAAMESIPDVPDAVDAWNAQRTLMAAYFAFSVLMIINFPFLLFIGIVNGILGTVASSMHLFDCCRGRGGITGAVVTIKVLAAIVASVGFVIAFFLLLALFGAEKAAAGYIFFVTFVYVAHSTMSLVVMRKMQMVYDVLHPVRSGMVVL